MKALRIYLLLVLTVAVPQSVKGSGKVEAQGAKPNLSGEWLLVSQSDSNSRRVSQPPEVQVQLSISHHDPEIKITRIKTTGALREVEEFTYYSDGRGEKNQGFGLTTKPPAVEKVQITSKSGWKKDKLIVRGSYRQALAGQFREVRQEDEWKLSSDGRTLTQTTTLQLDAVDVQVPSTRGQSISVRQPQVKSKRVYRRTTP